MDTLLEKMEAVMAAITEMNELFYQQKTKEGLDRLDRVIPDIGNTIDAIYAYGEEHAECSLGEVEFMEVLNEALAAMEAADYVMLADILQYDMMDKLEEAKKRIAG